MENEKAEKFVKDLEMLVREESKIAIPEDKAIGIDDDLTKYIDSLGATSVVIQMVDEKGYFEDGLDDEVFLIKPLSLRNITNYYFEKIYGKQAYPEEKDEGREPGDD